MRWGVKEEQITSQPLIMHSTNIYRAHWLIKHLLDTLKTEDCFPILGSFKPREMMVKWGKTSALDAQI